MSPYGARWTRAFGTGGSHEKEQVRSESPLAMHYLGLSGSLRVQRGWKVLHQTRYRAQRSVAAHESGERWLRANLATVSGKRIPKPVHECRGGERTKGE